MDEYYVPYEEALELKELGFNDYCMGAVYYKWVNRGNTFILLRTPDDSDSHEGVKAPLFCQAFRWFREKYGLFTSIIVDQTTKPKFYYNISEYYEDETTWEWKDGWGNSSLYRIYEEAELDCLKKLIEIAKTVTDNKTKK